MIFVFFSPNFAGKIAISLLEVNKHTLIKVYSNYFLVFGYPRCLRIEIEISERSLFNIYSLMAIHTENSITGNVRVFVMIYYQNNHQMIF